MATPEGIQQRFQGGVKFSRLYLGEDSSLTAHAGGGQTNALQLKGALEVVTTVASANDSVKLPGAEQSRVMIVINTTANAMQVFTQETTGVTINGTAGSTGVSVPAGHTAIFICDTAGTSWHAFGGSSL